MDADQALLLATASKARSRARPAGLSRQFDDPAWTVDEPEER
jgi:hypothetical protein